jgi:predicted deacylase
MIFMVSLLPRSIPEMTDMANLLARHPQLIRTETLAEIPLGKDQLPIQGWVIGSPRPEASTLALFAGVHGLERVGTHVLLTYLSSLLARLSWDENLQKLFENIRLITIPIVNPAGFALNRRSNAQGVDLMRNSPVEAEGKTMWGVAGQRLSPLLPWYRGSEVMEPEAKAVEAFVRRHMFRSDFAISLDLHSGFGSQDRLWYPWANSARAFPHEGQVKRLFELFEASYPYHIYKIEPQHWSYTTHGDLWDWLYLQHQEVTPTAHYLPLTLEMGSWMWVRKNPWQAFNLAGFFNPVKKHRYTRTMRRHLHLMDFLLNAVAHGKRWE